MTPSPSPSVSPCLCGENLPVTITAQRTRAYGTWQAVAQLPDGRQVTGYGLTEHHARSNAAKRVPCGTAGCPASLGPAEARIALDTCGAAICSTCRDRRFGPNTDPPEESEWEDPFKYCPDDWSPPAGI